jgi:predicted dehydrogenase
MKTIGFGIIGIGRQGLRLAEHIRKDIDHGKLVAVCRRSQEIHDYSKEHGIKFYSNHHDLLADDKVNAVIIATPSSLHGIQAIDALKAGKHLLIDKPIASTVKEGEQILALANKEGLTVAVNLPLRVHPVTAATKNNLANIGKLKKIQIIVSHGPLRSEWQRDLKLSNGGVILDLGSHYFDLLSFLTGFRPETIDNAYSEKIENEDSGFIDITYKDFSVSMVLLRNQKFEKNIMTFAGDKGFLFADYSGREVIVSNNHEINEIKCSISYDFETILNNLVMAINKKEDVIADAKAGTHALKIVLSIYTAIKTQKAVRL